MNKVNITQDQPCVLVVDYSTVIEDPILPFVFELDLAASNLEPDPGENQRFCYNVTGVGEDNSDFADLSHFVLGICEDITEDQLENVTVTIDGVPQTIIIGDNVEIFNPPDVDPPTGCSGLKFDFGLDKVEGEMTVCFELNVVYPIGPTELCLSGAGETRSGLSICGPVCNGEPVEETCPATAFVPMTVCTPVTVTPFANELPTTTFCCGDPEILPVTTGCPGTLNGVVTFIITQDICVRVPVQFGATTDVGDLFVLPGEPTIEDVCTNCGDNGGNGDKRLLINKLIYCNQ